MNLPQEKASRYPAIISVCIEGDRVTAELEDGRRVSIPVAWFESLAKASDKHLRHMEISPSGYGVHWPDLDEDISVRAFIDGLHE